MRLSVAMCTYNGEKYIQEQLESILKQTVSINEIIICDDGSIDKTIQIIENFQFNYQNKISLYKNQANIGSTKNFEQAITICSGDYIFLSDQDDIWNSNKVEKIMKFFDENQTVEGVFSNANLINEVGVNLKNQTLWNSVFFMENQLQKPIDLFSLIKSKRNMVTGATLCFKKEIKNLILPIPNIQKYYHDEWIAIIIASRNTLYYTTDKLISYRIHPKQQIGAKSSTKKNTVKKHIKISNFILGTISPKSYNDYSQLCKVYFRNYMKFKNISKNTKNNFHLNFNEIAIVNLDLFKECNNSLQKTNPVLYFLKNVLDRIRSKRQLN